MRNGERAWRVEKDRVQAHRSNLGQGNSKISSKQSGGIFLEYTALKQDDGEDGITWHLLQVPEMYIGSDGGKCVTYKHNSASSN